MNVWKVQPLLDMTTKKFDLSEVKFEYPEVFLHK